MLEGLSFCIYYFAPYSKGFVQKAVLDYYENHGRRIIQYEPTMSRYDERTSYRLKEGEFNFSNKEFDTTYSVNQKGLRDDNESLKSPEVVVLGDSFAMGWGVEQDECYASLFEQQSGRRVLNAGVSSFGTVRELMLLNEIDMSKVKLIILQYCSNDFNENAAFINGNYQVMPEVKYREVQNAYLSKSSYYFGKYLRKFFPIVFRELSRSVRGKKEKEIEVKDEFKPLEHVLAKLAPKGVPIILIELGGHHLMKNHFEDLKSMESISLYSLNVHPFLKENHYYPIDGHLNKTGHEMLAKSLMLFVSTHGLLE